MNAEKAKLKVVLFNDIGSEIEDIAEQYEREQFQFEGGVSAVKQVVEALKVLRLHVSKDLKQEKLDEDSATMVHHWLQRAIESASAIQTQNNALKLVSMGKSIAVRHIVDKLKKDIDRESSKLDRVGEDSTGREHIDTPAVANLAARKENNDTDPRP